MVEELNNQFEHKDNLQQELDAFKDSLEKNTKVSDELRGLYISLINEIMGNVERSKDLSLDDIADLQGDLEQLKLSGVESKLEGLAQMIQDIEEKKFEELSEEEKLAYISAIKDAGRKDRLIKQITNPNKILTAEHVEEEIDGPVADFYASLGLGGVVRELNKRGKAA